MELNPARSRPALASSLASGRWAHGAAVALSLAVAAVGLFAPDLMGGDAAQDAVMAMRMHQEGDWVNLVKNGRDYLDKPHLLFWSAVASYRLFGVHDWAYRLPSALVALAAAYAVHRLGALLASRTAGRIAAVLYLTAPNIVFGNHDVRMDALLAGFTAFAVWQLAEWVETGRWRNALLGAAFVGLGFSTKGLVAVAVAGTCLFFHVWARAAWRRLPSLQVVAGVAVFALVISPVLVAYWLQFDAHPEKVVGGRTGVSGVRFILFGQSLERFSGGRGHRGSDPLFLFHTLLWAFAPWGLLLYAGWARRARELWRGGRAAFRGREQLSFLGPLAFIAVLSFSAFKLPHYLSWVIPILAVFTAAHLAEWTAAASPRTLGALRIAQDAVVALVIAAVVVLNVWSFPPREAWIRAGLVALLALTLAAFAVREPLVRLWAPGAFAALALGFTLNASLFPELGRFQPGRHLAARAAELGVDPRRTFFVDEIYQPYQFYGGRLLPVVEEERLAREAESGAPTWALVGDLGLGRLEAAGLARRVVAGSPACAVTKFRPELLRPDTRARACPRAHLVEVGR